MRTYKISINNNKLTTAVPSRRFVAASYRFPNKRENTTAAAATITETTAVSLLWRFINIDMSAITPAIKRGRTRDNEGQRGNKVELDKHRELSGKKKGDESTIGETIRKRFAKSNSKTIVLTFNNFFLLITVFYRSFSALWSILKQNETFLNKKKSRHTGSRTM